MIGWQLIGYPGPRMSYREEIGQYPGEAWRAKPVSRAGMVGARKRRRTERKAYDRGYGGTSRERSGLAVHRQRATR